MSLRNAEALLILHVKAFLHTRLLSKLVLTMDSGREQLKKLEIVKKSVEELSLSYAETLENLKDFSENLSSLKSLWKIGNKSKLVKWGLSLIILPEPTPISEIMGATLLSVGLIQQKIRNCGLHIEDVQKTFQEVFENLDELRERLVRY